MSEEEKYFQILASNLEKLRFFFCVWRLISLGFFICFYFFLPAGLIDGADFSSKDRIKNTGTFKERRYKSQTCLNSGLKMAEID